MNSDDGRGVSDCPRHRKRVVTNARKEQNRIAQKLYRQRQKERVQKRQSSRHDQSGKQRRQLKPRQSQDILLVASQSMNLGNLGAATAEAHTESNHAALLSENALQPDFLFPLDHNCMTYGFVPDDKFNSDDISFPSMDSPSLFGADSGMSISTLGCRSTLLQAPSMTVDTNEAGSESRIPVSEFLEVHTMNEDPLSMFDSSLNSPASMDATRLSWYTHQHELPGEKSPNTLLCLSNPAEDSGCYPQSHTSNIVNDPRDLRNALINVPGQIPRFEGIISATFIFLYGRQVPTGSTPPLPDPYINILQCSLAVTLQAYADIARCIGLEIQDILNNKSPFYKPNTTIADDPQALLAATHKHWIPIHLQPTLPQILIPHHPYLDLLPFPALRARAITLAATAPHLFQPLELKKDILRDGLYYNRYGSKQPCDVGSWEAAPWFLRKWRLLVG